MMKDIIVRAAQVTDQSNEVLFAVAIVDGRLRARRASPSFFAFLRSSRYIVRRRFDPPEVVLGTTLKILNKASGDELEITPRITVEGAAENKLQQVVESFHDHYTAQESLLKSTVARLLTNYIEQDSDPIKALFEPGLNKNWDYQLRRDLLDQLGLEARIEIVFDPEVAPWIEKIRGHPARTGRVSVRIGDTT